MADTYFNKFPLINYNGVPCVDITRRAVISNTTLLNPYIFTPITINNSIRSEQLSRQYYGDPYQEWVIFMTNQITDPYDSWYMDSTQFNDFILQKYGSLTLPQQTIMYYTNNWYDNVETITVSNFDALSTNLQKYYEPTFDGFGQINGYNRIQVDWTTTTNHLVSFNFANTIPTFIDNEIVAINYTANNVGSGQVASFGNNYLNIQHVAGYYLPNGSINAASFSIVGSQSNSTITVANANSVTITSFDALPDNEDIFYDAVTQWDYENNKNESNKVLQMLLPQFVPQVSADLQNVLNS